MVASSRPSPPLPPTSTAASASAPPPQENAALRGTWRRQASTYVLEDTESPEVIPAPFAVFAEESVAPVPVEFSPHRHAHHELVWVRGGTMTVRLVDRMLTVPEGRGLWIPAGVEHSGRMTAHTKLCDAFFDVERSPVAFEAVTGIEMTPLLESLLTHLQDPTLEEAARLRAEAVVFDVLTPAVGEQLSLTVPASKRIAPIVATLLADPAHERGLSEWAQTVGTSERTVSRAFRQATGLSFVQWRQALRIQHAVSLLAEGVQVQEIAERLGYAQPSTFIAAFKRTVGLTPGSYAETLGSVPPASTSPVEVSETP